MVAWAYDRRRCAARKRNLNSTASSAGACASTCEDTARMSMLIIIIRMITKSVYLAGYIVYNTNLTLKLYYNYL